MVSRKDFELLEKDIRTMYPMLKLLETHGVLAVNQGFGKPGKLQFSDGFEYQGTIALDANQIRTLGFELVELGDRLAALTIDMGEEA